MPEVNSNIRSIIVEVNMKEGMAEVKKTYKTWMDEFSNPQEIIKQMKKDLRKSMKTMTIPFVRIEYVDEYYNTNPYKMYTFNLSEGVDIDIKFWNGMIYNTVNTNKRETTGQAIGQVGRFVESEINFLSQFLVNERAM